MSMAVGDGDPDDPGQMQELTVASDITIGPRPRIDGARSTRVARIALAVAVGAALVASAAATDPADAARAASRAGPALATLLRFMAVVKAAASLALLGILVWRLGLVTTFPRFTIYAASAMAAAAGPVLIWGLVHVALGAVLLHGGLVVGLVALWRDPEIDAHLSRLVAARGHRVVARRPSRVSPAAQQQAPWAEAAE